jgi:molybdopterin synthase catalytic subunit
VDVVIGPPIDTRERNWIAVSEQVLPTEAAMTWASEPATGAIVCFCGTVRDHSPGRESVTSLEYEVDAVHAVPRLERVAMSARRQWPVIGRLALLHRSGLLTVGEVSVVVVAATPHRAEAFDVVEYCIDTLKRTVPIWKLETWSGGTDWSACAHDIEDASP